MSYNYPLNTGGGDGGSGYDPNGQISGVNPPGPVPFPPSTGQSPPLEAQQGPIGYGNVQPNIPPPNPVPGVVYQPGYTAGHGYPQASGYPQVAPSAGYPLQGGQMPQQPVQQQAPPSQYAQQTPPMQPMSAYPSQSPVQHPRLPSVGPMGGMVGQQQQQQAYQAPVTSKPVGMPVQVLGQTSQLQDIERIPEVPVQVLNALLDFIAYF